MIEANILRGPADGVRCRSRVGAGLPVAQQARRSDEAVDARCVGRYAEDVTGNGWAACGQGFHGCREQPVKPGVLIRVELGCLMVALGCGQPRNERMAYIMDALRDCRCGWLGHRGGGLG